MSNITVKGKDAFWDFICFHLANNSSYIPTEEFFPIQFEFINSDHCPLGYKGVKVFVKETELKKYERE